MLSAIAAAADARREWAAAGWEQRAAVFLRAADLLAGPWRDTLNAATMLGQSKTAFQAEIDAACELADFWRFNVAYMQRLMSEQPISSPGVWNQVEYRPLEGFVFAVAPFNFTAIAGNLPTAPAMMGNTVLLEAGVFGGAFGSLPDQAAGGGRDAAGRRSTWCSARVARSATRCLPTPISPASISPAQRRYSTACGARSATTSTGTAATRGSWARPAARTSSSLTRRPIPTRWPPRSSAADSSTRDRSARPARACTRPPTCGREIRARLEREVAEIAVGDVRDFRNFMGAVIDASSFATHKAAIEAARGVGRRRRSGGRRGRRLARIFRAARR